MRGCMSVVTQKLRLEPNLIDVNEWRVKIPKKGKKIPASKMKTEISGLPVTQIVEFFTTNYIPGKVIFESKEES